MKNKIINYKGYEVLHRHVLNWVWFDAWKGQNKINNRQIRKEQPFFEKIEKGEIL